MAPPKSARAARRWDEGVQFDSLLERRHSVMMTQLRIPWTRNVWTFHQIRLADGSLVSYTPDFVVRLPEPCLVEIKPRYPYDDELRKCEAACRQMAGAMSVLLLFHTDFRCPFEVSRQQHASYEHSDGVRGMRYSWDRRRVAWTPATSPTRCARAARAARSTRGRAWTTRPASATPR